MSAPHRKTSDTDTFPITPATVATNALTLLAYGAKGEWDETCDVIEGIHEMDGDMLARVFAAYYQMVKSVHGEQASRQRIGRSLAHIELAEHAAVRVADVLLDQLAHDDIPGFADAWDGVRFAFGGRNVVPVAAAVLLIVLGALEPEDEDAYLLLDRLTEDGAFVSILRQFGYGDDPITADCG